jgi:subfamily B ATP-binding cassette protein MsbA
MTKNNPVQSDFKTYFRLLSYARPYWLAFLLSILGWSLTSAMQAGVGDVLRLVLYFVGEDDKTLANLKDAGIIANFLANTYGAEALHNGRIIISMMFAGLVMVRGVGFFIGTYFISYVGTHLVYSLRMDLFQKMLRLPTTFYDQNMSGHLVSRLTYQVTQVTSAATSAVKTIIAQGTLVISLLAYLFYLNWKLTLIYMAIFPLLGLVVGLVSKRFRKLSKRIQASVGDVTHVAQESVTGYRVMRTFSGEKYETQRMKKASMSNLKQTLKMALTEGISTPIMQGLAALGLAILIWIALSPELVEQMSAGMFVAYLTTAGLLTKPIRQLSEVNSTIQKGLAASQDIFETIDTAPELDVGTHTQQCVDGRFEFKNINFSYEGTKERILEDISFNVEAGQTIALVGPSGSGKSTLVNLIPRFYNCTGQMLLDDVDINEFTLTNLREHISFVNQQVTLFNASIYDNIAYGGLAGMPKEDVYRAADLANAKKFIEEQENGFDTIVGDDGVKLSGGQRQRIAIARALLKKSPVLILDEATSALDTESERAIQSALENLMQDRTTFVIAHRLSTVENADRILVMDKGCIVEQGTHSELLALNNRYAGLYNRGFDENAG